MKFTKTIELDRNTHFVLAEVEGEVSKHFGQLEVSDFCSDIPLSAQEIDEAQEALLEKARYEGGAFFQEQEPDARRYAP